MEVLELCGTMSLDTTFLPSFYIVFYSATVTVHATSVAHVPKHITRVCVNTRGQLLLVRVRLLLLLLC